MGIETGLLGGLLGLTGFGDDIDDPAKQDVTFAGAFGFGQPDYYGLQAQHQQSLALRQCEWNRQQQDIKAALDPSLRGRRIGFTDDLKLGPDGTAQVPNRDAYLVHGAKFREMKLASKAEPRKKSRPNYGRAWDALYVIAACIMGVLGVVL